MTLRYRASLAGIVVLAACTTANLGRTAPERQTRRAFFRAPYDAVYQAIIQEAGTLAWAVLYSDKDAGAVRVSYPQTLGAWGDTVAVNMMRSDSGVAVEVRGHLGQEPNQRKLQAYLNGVAVRLGLQP